ncbi:cytochrome c3 family protein [Desulfobulbus rhabdoformis]|uniref:cytochrome c3 family protein n=1 Tax=Desulfobulbus rhabdoformis TaxID=34032 RepID=UPI001965C02A|nr:cytochrome c3 family protein [Desulfobulbus rhabdoformis]MBM9616469.1 cytochrome c3 family protein [Desulfobulbus rhabdoformis]
MKKSLIHTCLVALCCAPCVLSLAQAADKGPAEITLESTIDGNSKPKPSAFPHGQHQTLQECSACHHSKDAEGKKIDYVEGQKIEKCETCHNTKEVTMSAKVNTFKKAAHKQCKTCHKNTDPKLAKCSVCHK